MRKYSVWVVVVLLVGGTLMSRHTTPARERPADGKPFAHVPDTVSPEAKKYLESLPDPSTLPVWPAPDDLVAWKRNWDAGETASEPKVLATLKRYEPSVKEAKVGGVPVLDIKPKGWKDNGKLLVHTHGGAYTMYSARSRLQSSVPAAFATGLRVISIDYTLAPFAKWPQVTDQVLAVFDGLLKDGYKLKDIAIYGESAGGGLAAGAVLKMRDKGLGMPTAIVLWSPWADITNRGESAETMKPFDPAHVYDRHLKPSADAYADPKDQKHPYVSPVYGDYSKGFPPTLIQGGTREIFLSHFVRQYRAIDDAGGTAILDLYEGMPHVFQLRPEMADAPETKTALKKMAAFLKQHLRE
ncbi:MAG: alpha/beta hydrolase [Planctomycetes bacterium]|nr:alpha/beta hydrolase [Planctomycetota bacterium]